MRKHSSVSGNSFDTMVRAIKDYDGLDSRECYKLKDFVDDLDTLRGGVDSQEGNELKQVKSKTKGYDWDIKIDSNDPMIKTLLKSKKGKIKTYNYYEIRK